jgi:hypothetical protein
MKEFLKKTIIAPILFITSPITLLASIWLKIVKLSGTGKAANSIFMKIGILPVLDHYYQPLINPKKHLLKSLREDRILPGIDFNENEQLLILSQFNFNSELLEIPINFQSKNEFFFNNGNYESGDAEYLYNIIRLKKPKRIIEIGSGFSTLMAKNAINKNKIEDSNYNCK